VPGWSSKQRRLVRTDPALAQRAVFGLFLTTKIGRWTPSVTESFTELPCRSRGRCRNLKREYRPGRFGICDKETGLYPTA
jgi:hypothetical protein